MASEKLAEGSPGNVRATRKDDTSTVCGNRLVVDELLVSCNPIRLHHAILLTDCLRMLLRKKISTRAISEVMVHKLRMTKGLISSSSKRPLSG